MMLDCAKECKSENPEMDFDGMIEKAQEVVNIEKINASVQIVNVKNVDFRINPIMGYSFSRGFAFYVPGLGYLKFKSDRYVYVLGTKKVAQSILDAGGFQSMENLEFVNA